MCDDVTGKHVPAGVHHVPVGQRVAVPAEHLPLRLRMCLQVFTTCGSDRKKQYLLDTFPQLREDHIGHSRDCSFEDLIMHMVRPHIACHVPTAA